MVVYLDGVLLLNSLVDYLLLVVCGNVTATPVQRIRVLGAGLCGGIYAILTLLPGFSFLGQLHWAAVMAWVLTVLAFGTRPGMIRRSVVLLLLTASFSGIVTLLTEVFSAPNSLLGHGVYYPLSFSALVLTAGGSYGLMKMGLDRMTHHGGDVVEVEVTLLGKKTAFTALRDTGNTLHDPVSGIPVMVADKTVLTRLLEEKHLPEDPVELLQYLGQKVPELHPRLIPYKTVGVENGLLLAITPDKVMVSGREERQLLAFSAASVSDGGGYEALIGGTI